MECTRPKISTLLEDFQEVHPLVVFRYFNVSFDIWYLFLDIFLF